jgi:putrescine aminotransferase
VVASGDFTGDRVAAVVIEPIQGEGGIVVAPPGYLKAAREICDQYGCMLIFDEVQSGMARSGKMFCCEHDGVTPDLMALGKGFGGGVMPIGAVVGTPRTWQKYIENPFLHTTTFGGNPLACAAAIATIHVLLEENLAQAAAEKGEYLLTHMNALAAKYPKVMKLARGRGLMLGMEFTDNDLGYKVATELFGRQILISGTYINARVLRVEPALTIGYPQLDTFLTALEESLKAVSAKV